MIVRKNSLVLRNKEKESEGEGERNVTETLLLSQQARKRKKCAKSIRNVPEIASHRMKERENKVPKNVTQNVATEFRRKRRNNEPLRPERKRKGEKKR